MHTYSIHMNVPIQSFYILILYFRAASLHTAIQRKFDHKVQ